MLILASSSPRRKQILSEVIPSFLIIPPSIDEDSVVADPFSLPAKESELKAEAIYKDHPNDEIISCDTIVLLDGKVLGKPKDEDDAIRMLSEESGKLQLVISGYTYIGKGVRITRSVISKVMFKKLSLEQIKDYVKNKKPLDKAGAYGIQDECGLIASIEGSYHNVMGFPIEDIVTNTPILD